MWAGDPTGSYLATVALWATGFFIFYFFILNGIYLAFLVSGFFCLLRYNHDNSIIGYYRLFGSRLMRPISILVPAYNEEKTIIESVNSLRLLHYPQLEIVVIDDGSTDSTLQRLKDEFQLVRVNKVVRQQLESQPVKVVYESRRFPNIVVVCKANGGKSDALNCGINYSHYPYFCTLDADTILQEDALLKMIRPFIRDPEGMVAVGGIVRVSNNCDVVKGRITKIRLPNSVIELVQVVEYLQAFLSSRLAFSSADCILLISGVFGMFRKDAVILAGGYRKTIGEDMELVVRLHKTFRNLERPCRMKFLPDPVCWTEVPSDLGSLSVQRRRWQKGLIESMALNSVMLFNPRYGRLGMLAMPYYLVFEMVGPIIELFGYISLVVFLALNLLSVFWAWMFFLMAVGIGALISTGAILLEEISLHRYPQPRHLVGLLVGSLFYNFGFRQLNAFWKLQATLEYIFGYRSWGQIRRRGFEEEKKVA